jgi:branched-chain amino acid aminotransferase
LRTTERFSVLTKTSTTGAGALVMDEPKRSGATPKNAVKPAVDSKTTSPKATTAELTIYLDGKFVPEADAKVSVFDHGLLYGDGVFEGIRFYNGRVFRLEEHLERLWDSARSICLEIPIGRGEMTEALLETIRRNGLREGYIRLVVTRGVGNLGLNPTQCKRPSIFIIATTIALYPKEVCETGLTVVTCATRRTGAAALNPAVKSLNYLNNVMARIEANLAGADEALMLNEAGNVAECTADNVFIIKRGQIFTPPIAAGALRGITRSVVFDIAAELGIKITETDITRHDVFVADECFLSGTAAEVIPVVKADGRVIGNGKPGSITMRMIGRFRELTRETGTPISA